MYAQPLPDNTDRARWAVALLMINLCLFGIMFVRDLLKLLAESLYYMNYGIVQVAEGALELCGSLLIIITSVFFIMWFRRAYNNLHIAGARGLPYSEGWAAGGWFVPIIHWFYPYRIMSAIWNDTPAVVRKAGERFQPPPGGVIGAWWACWIIANVMSTIQSQLLLRGGVSLGHVSITVLDVLSDGCMVAAAWLGTRIIKTVSEMEGDLQRRYHEWQVYQTHLYAHQLNQQQAFQPQQEMRQPPSGPPQ